MKDFMDTNSIDRRKALRVIGSSVAAAAVVGTRGVAFADGKVDCSKEGTIDKTSKQMRTALKYVEQSKKKGQVCSGCLQWVAPDKGKSCGGCKLFTGPVNPNGYCLSYAPKKK